MSVASRRRVRQRLAEINLHEDDGMSRPWMDNLANKDIKKRPERSQGQPMETEELAEGNIEDAAAAKGKTADLKAAVADAKAKGEAEVKHMKEASDATTAYGERDNDDVIGRCQCDACGDHPGGCGSPASFNVHRLGKSVNVCSNCLQPTDSHNLSV